MAWRLTPAPEIRRHNQTLVTSTQQVQIAAIFLASIIAQAYKQGRVYARAGLPATARSVRCSAVGIGELLRGPGCF